ncbi:MAG: hypothetical protein AAGG38_11010 [Planctomycetota bacterium]
MPTTIGATTLGIMLAIAYMALTIAGVWFVSALVVKGFRDRASARDQQLQQLQHRLEELEQRHAP